MSSIAVPSKWAIRFLSGTSPVDEAGNVVAPNNAYAQARHGFEIIQQALQAFGADCDAVVRTRMFVTDISRWQEFAQAHADFFAAHPPASTMVEVKALIDSTMLIKVEADAVCALANVLKPSQDDML